MAPDLGEAFVAIMEDRILVYMSVVLMWSMSGAPCFFFHISHACSVWRFHIFSYHSRSPVFVSDHCSRGLLYARHSPHSKVDVLRHKRALGSLPLPQAAASRLLSSSPPASRSLRLRHPRLAKPNRIDTFAPDPFPSTRSVNQATNTCLHSSGSDTATRKPANLRHDFSTTTSRDPPRYT